MAITRESVGTVIRSYRESRGLTLRSLAEKLDVPFTSLSKMESGDQKVDSTFLVSVADYFDVSIDTMLNRTTNPVENEHHKKENKLDIQATLKHVLDTYQEAKYEMLKDHEIGNYVRNVIKDVLVEDADLDEHRFFVTGSVGQGRWAEIPWVSIFIRDITTTATSGYYIVYLFKADMSGVYISLNQGWTYFLRKYMGKLGREKIQATANIIQRKLNTVPANMTTAEINLEGRGDLAKGYENGHIIGRLYEADNLPSSTELINDLKELLTSYKEIEYMMGGRSVDEFNDYLLLSEDGHYLEEDLEQEEVYQDNVQLALDSTLDETEEAIEADNESLPRPDPVLDRSRRQRWPRDARVAARALRLSKYKCALDESHTSFTSKVTGKRYLEMHHLVPMKYQGEFDVKLDREAQLLALCPTCHRQIHHGTDDEKEIILRKLFYDRRDRLEAIGIEIGFKELRNMYGIKG
ncbi:5-methylcytosine-specific restriction enzyme A [Terribacillus saccharophilus]|uniref:5-methylcytosine-specific restriction enzyme A n=1 Tax=Terribacillus saccharophilus TaxID=361277 RepID=A0AAX2EJW1_9BACI|nr:5-methylcytosine-specific restriction enzyme A [Terribacillus saccharophilus]